MLPGITKTLTTSSGGLPTGPRGNDSFTIALLQFRQPSGWDLTTSAINDDSPTGNTRLWRGSAGSAVAIIGGPRFESWFHRGAVFNGGSLERLVAGAPQFEVWPGSDFTIDLFVKPHASQTSVIVCKSSPTFSPYLILQAGGAWQFYASSNNSAWDIANARSLGAATVGVWSHLAVQRKGNNWTTFNNGVAQATWSSSLAPYRDDNALLRLGAYPNGTNPFIGMVDQFRYSNVARYGASFAIPREPYTGALSGGNDAATTVLLHAEGPHGDNVFVEDARGGLPHDFKSAAGAITSATQHKFGATSVGLPNTGSAVTLADCTDLDFLLQNWTIDFWYFRTAASGTHEIFSRLNGFSMMIRDVAGVLQLYLSSNGGSWDIANGVNCGALALNAWTHVAIIRDYPNFRAHINGIQSATFASTAAIFVPGGTSYIGALPTSAPGGFIDEFRVSDTVRWPMGFSPEVAAYGPKLGDPPAWPPERPVSTLLLLHGEAFVDSSLKPHPVTGGGATANDTPARFGGSHRFDLSHAAGAGLQVDGPVSDWSTTNTWTLEWWDYWGGASDFAAAMFTTDYWSVSGTTGVGGFGGAGGVSWSWWSFVFLSVGGVDAGVWAHRAIQRNGNTFTAWKDGVVTDTATNANGNPANTSPLRLGGAGRDYVPPGDGTPEITAGPIFLLDDIRMSAVARYSGNFQVPLAPFGPYG